MTASLPRIAVLLDENTSGDAALYESPKTLFRMVAEAGAMPLGIPYLPGLEDEILAAHDGLISPGGRFAFPKAWYIAGRSSVAPVSERCDFDLKLMRMFLDAGKPVFGICSGMQMMAGLAGCKLVGDIQDTSGQPLVHNGPDCTHDVTISEGSRLAAIMGTREANINSLHNEAVVDLPRDVAVSARAPDGVIEGIELESYSFAIGVQWHPEKYHGKTHPGNALFGALVEACGLQNLSL
jgi:putative glutamine amidotransferase